MSAVSVCALALSHVIECVREYGGAYIVCWLTYTYEILPHEVSGLSLPSWLFSPSFLSSHRSSFPSSLSLVPYTVSLVHTGTQKQTLVYAQITGLHTPH